MEKVGEQKTMIYATNADGIIKGEDGVYSNSDFVSEIHEDPTPMGALMRSEFPSTTVVKITGDTPKSWQEWTETLSMAHARIMLVDQDIEIPPHERMTTGRKVLSTRSIITLSKAGMKVTPRGVSSLSTPPSPEVAAAWIVYGLYHLVERNTTASLRSESGELSQSRKSKYESVMTALDPSSNVMDVALLSTYTEPSATLIRRLYCLGSLQGVDMAHTMINSLYHRSCRDQVSSVTTCWDMM